MVFGHAHGQCAAHAGAVDHAQLRSQARGKAQRFLQVVGQRCLLYRHRRIRPVAGQAGGQAAHAQLLQRCQQAVQALEIGARTVQGQQRAVGCRPGGAQLTRQAVARKCFGTGCGGGVGSQYVRGLIGSLCAARVHVCCAARWRV
jgi:hypothetical protein